MLKNAILSVTSKTNGSNGTSSVPSGKKLHKKSLTVSIRESIFYFKRNGVAEENLRLRENLDKDGFSSVYKQIKGLSHTKFSSVILIKRKKSRRHWKKWRKEFELDRNPTAFSSMKKKDLERNIKNASRRYIFRDKSRTHEQEKYFALKVIRLHRYNDKEIEILKKEVALLKMLDHPYIVRAYETYLIPKQKLNIVMEYCSGGDLWTRTPCHEDDARKYMKQILSAISFLHDRHIIHRDIKMENILFESTDIDTNVKLIDFGLSTKMIPNEDQTARVGTVYTMSPEVVRRSYTTKADIWACGVIAYALVSDHVPFSGNGAEEVMRLISEGVYSFTPLETWEKISLEMKDFIHNMLLFDPKERFNVTLAQNHTWFKNNPLEKQESKPDQNTMKEATQNLIDSKPYGLKKLALYTIATRLSIEEVEQIRQIFDQYDTLNNGVISYDEFKGALAQFDISEDEISLVFQRLTFTDNGLIYYTDFISALLESQDIIDEDKLADAFDIIDTDDSGNINFQNLRHFLDEKSYNDAEIQAILDEADRDRDGLVSFADFLEIFRKDRKEITSKIRLKENSINKENHATLQPGISTSLHNTDS